MSYSITKINVDADHWVRKAAMAAIASTEDNEEITESRCYIYLWGLMSAQFSRLQELLVSKKDRIETKEYILYLLNKGALSIYLGPHDRMDNFRYKVATIQPYKGNREELNPVQKKCMKWLRERLIDKWKAIVVEGMETDDRVSIESNKDPMHTLTISNDKDDRQTPGWHWWWESNLSYCRKPYYVDPDEWGVLMLEKNTGGKTELFATGRYQIAYQMLTGDGIDNIPAVARGYGPVKCYEILKKSHGDCPPEVITKQIYIDIYGEKEGQRRFEEVEQLVRMKTE